MILENAGRELRDALDDLQDRPPGVRAVLLRERLLELDRDLGGRSHEGLDALAAVLRADVLPICMARCV